MLHMAHVLAFTCIIVIPQDIPNSVSENLVVNGFIVLEKIKEIASINPFTTMKPTGGFYYLLITISNRGE
jgi:hypothetical protein